MDFQTSRGLLFSSLNLASICSSESLSRLDIIQRITLMHMPTALWTAPELGITNFEDENEITLPTRTLSLSLRNLNGYYMETKCFYQL